MFFVKQLLDVGRAFIVPLPISLGLNAKMRFEDISAHFQPHLAAKKNDERENTDKNSIDVCFICESVFLLLEDCWLRILLMDVNN